ncbi:MAG TPA: hypothetical protein VLJ84_12520 [Usitatibacter sp.]|nr:hypothetical protein [Usitatibacter sp.]
MVALVGHGDQYFVVDVVLVVELDGVVDDEVLSEFVLLEPLGEVLAETLPLAPIDAEVEVSLDGVVVTVVVVLLGDEVSVEAVVVGGVVATVVEVVVEPGVALVPELL